MCERVAELLPKRAGGLIVGLFALGLGVGAGVGLTLGLLAAFGPQGASATHGGSNTVHACVSRFTGHARIMLPGQPPNCTSSETLVELGSGAAAAGVEARVADLEDQLEDLACIQTAPGVNPNVADIVFTGCNVQVVSGAGATDAPVNGLGNLIVGYNENGDSDDRGGSHNLVAGADHGYSSFGGFVAGFDNQLQNMYASISGGRTSVASGPFASVSGGTGNTASGDSASISGGSNNTASGFVSSVSGGNINLASGTTSSILGGDNNTASGELSTVSAGFVNVASGDISTVSGGIDNEANGSGSTVSGGTGLTANAPNEHLP